ncbi:integrase [Pseudomonas kermanshahensis]|uniref:Integrase n=1 Tax=Pseudomonas kermanshahensis TaxID=2745482 RepID=A0ABU8R6U7_9PSED
MPQPDITRLNERHFRRAVELLEDSSCRQGTISTLLQMLAFLSEKLILPAEVIRWQNPYVGDRSYSNLRGNNAPAAVKRQKVVNQDALFSIADVFSRPLTNLDDSDIMITSLTALLLSAPMRIGETLRWRTDCLRSEIDKNGAKQKYLAYYVPKTQSYTRKPIPATMTEVATEAIERLRSITEEGRRLARHMELTPTKFYRHPDCPDVPDDKLLTRQQVAQALGYIKTEDCMDFIKKHTGNYRLTGFTLETLWQLILIEHRNLNPHFPYQTPLKGMKPLKMSESLMCFRRSQFGAQRSTSPVLLTPFNPDYYRKRLDGTVRLDRKNQRPICFFAKHGLDLLRLNSHSLRHFVNRLAKQSGVSIETITEWSSRASIQQTRTYLHESSEQSRNRAAVIHGTKQEQQPREPITEEEANSYGRGPFHRSRYGICRRSWRAGPCIKFADCTNCSELLACKGDKIALEAVKSDLENMQRTRDAAERAVSAGERSGGMWLAKAEPQIIRLTELIRVLENPEIPDGSPIQIQGTDFSHESTLIREKAQESGIELLDKDRLAIEYGQDLIDCLNMLTN